MIKLRLFFLSTFLILGGCGISDLDILPEIGSNDTKAPSVMRPDTCFVPYPNNPVIADHDVLPDANWDDINIPQKNILGPSGIVAYGVADSGWKTPLEIYRLTSENGLQWEANPKTPVLSPSEDSAAWDSKSVKAPSVIFFQDQYHMFYAGYSTNKNDLVNYRIGHAVSDDGIHWEKDEDFILGPSDPDGSVDYSFDQYFVSEPSAIVYNDEIYLYFTAVGVDKTLNKTLQTIGLVRSPNGKYWSIPEPVITPDQEQYPRTQNVGGFSTPSAIVMAGKVHLFVDIVQADPYEEFGLYHMVSANGVENWRHDDGPIHLRGDFAWSKDTLRAPEPFLKNGKLHLLYTGKVGKMGGIGLSTCGE